MIVRTITMVTTLTALFAIPLSVADSQQQQQQQQQAQQRQAGSLAELGLTAALTGKEVIGDSAASAGAGTAKAAFALRQATKEVCYDITLTDLSDVTGASIHKAPKGENGPAIVPIEIRKDSATTKGCTKVEDAIFAEISANPANYYLQVNTASSPKGAIRGQLIKPQE